MYLKDLNFLRSGAAFWPFRHRTGMNELPLMLPPSLDKRSYINKKHSDIYSATGGPVDQAANRCNKRTANYRRKFCCDVKDPHLFNSSEKMRLRKVLVGS